MPDLSCSEALHLKFSCYIETTGFEIRVNLINQFSMAHLKFKLKVQQQQLTICLLLFVFSGLLLWYFYQKEFNTLSTSAIVGILLLIFSTGSTLLFFCLVTWTFGFTDFKRGFLNFLIGDNGTYSLSRLQAVLWAIVIISYQISFILCLCLNKNGFYFNLYQPLFSESANWLLGLSLTSYVAVKGITNNTFTANPLLFKRRKVVPKISDILVGDNGLDFSKCQMLLWTLLAVIVFESKCFYYNRELISRPQAGVIQLFGRFYDEYNAKNKPEDPTPFIPYLPWSFVVLMGMSQGVYVGKKLVPTFKLDDMKADKQDAINDQLTQLAFKNKVLAQLNNSSLQDPKSSVDPQAIKVMTDSIKTTEETIESLKGDVNQINAHLT